MSPKVILPQHNTSDHKALTDLRTLAPWIVSDACMIEHASHPNLRAHPPLQPGDLSILFVFDTPPHPILAHSFLLPVRWTQTPPPSPSLPQSLTSLAAQIAQRLQIEGWHLVPGSPLDAHDLSTLELDCGSAGAILAAGLIAASEGYNADPHVFATGTWRLDDGSLSIVDHLDLKVHALHSYARRAAVRKDITLFIPPAQEHTEHEDIKIISLPTERGIRNAIAPLLAALDQPPIEQATLELWRQWAERPHNVKDATTRDLYYSKYVAPLVAQRLQQSPAIATLQRADLLLTLVSHGNTAQTILHTFLPKHALLCFTPETSAHLCEVEALCDSLGTTHSSFLLPADDITRESIDGLRGLITSLNPDKLLFDATGGTKPMVLVAERSLRGRGLPAHLSQEQEHQSPAILRHRGDPRPLSVSNHL